MDMETSASSKKKNMIKSITNYFLKNRKVNTLCIIIISECDRVLDECLIIRFMMFNLFAIKETLEEETKDQK